MSENCIKIQKGTRASRSVIEIQAYITQLESNDYRLKKRIKEAEQLNEKYEKLAFDYTNVVEQLEQANTVLSDTLF